MPEDRGGDRNDPGNRYWLCEADAGRKGRSTEAEANLPVRRAGSPTWVAGFTIVPNVVLRDPKLTPVAKVVYFTLLDYARDNGQAWPGLEAMGERLGIATTTVRVSVKALAVAGLIERQRRGRGLTTVYRLLDPRPAKTAGFRASRPPDSAGLDRRISHPKKTKGKKTKEKNPSSVPVEAGSEISAKDKAGVEAVGLVETLVELIVANGSRRPRPGDGWYDAARLLLTNDGVALADAERVMRWCQADGFWRGNVLSMPTFRKRYDQLRLAAERDRGRPGVSGVDDLAEYLRRKEGA